MIVTLEELKAHLNIVEDTDDDLLDRKLAAAQDHIERLLGFKIEDEYGGDEQDPVPPALAEAVAQLAGHFYENREATLVGISAQELPLGVADAVREYRNWSF